MTEFLNAHLDAIIAASITGVIGIISVLLTIKYGRYKPKPDLIFFDDAARVSTADDGKYLLRIFSEVKNVGHAIAHIKDISINGIFPGRELKGRTTKDDLLINSFSGLFQNGSISIDEKTPLRIIMEAKKKPKNVRIKIFTFGIRKPFVHKIELKK